MRCSGRGKPGSLGLVMSRGKATDRSLLPGGHFVFAFRRVIIEEYPSVELAYRADGQSADEGVGFNRHLGDRRVSRCAFDLSSCASGQG